MASEAGEEKEEQAGTRPSSVPSGSSGKATPTKGPGSANASGPGSVAGNSAIQSRPGTVTPGRVSDGVTPVSQIPSQVEVEPPPPPPPPVKKEPNVIVDPSLNLLAVHIVQKRFLLAMYLNVPTVDLVITETQVREQQLAHKKPPTLDHLRQQLEHRIAKKQSVEQPEQLTPEAQEQDVAFRLLKHWRSLKGNAKDKDKVMELVRALKMIERTDLGDIVVNQNKENLELTLAVLPVIKTPSNTGAVTKPKKIKSTTKAKK
ncbi:hypothetical protein LSAT2_015282 [Lamellibrachia satsuma]|nr:hypothetical protein LSAT2_015282 [Lamellibrachia satsuma]